MAHPEQHFDAATFERVIAQWVRDDSSKRILVLLEGDVRALADEIRVRSGPGRVVQARAGAREGSRALGLAFLARGGRVETADDPRPGAGGGPWAPFGAVLSEARLWAESIRDYARPLGGLSALVRADRGRIAARPELPEQVRHIAALADGRRTVARIMSAAGADELLTARVLARLQAEGLLTTLGPDDEQDPLLPAPRPEGSHFSMPAQGWGETSALPETDVEEYEGGAVATDVRHWLQTEDAPPTLLSDEAFLGAYVAPEPAPSRPATGAPRRAGTAGRSARGPRAERRVEPARPRPAPVVEPRTDPMGVPVVEPRTDPAQPPLDGPRTDPAQPPLDGPRTDPPATAPSDGPVEPIEGRPAAVREGVPYTTRRPEPADEDELFREAGVQGGLPIWVIGLLLLGALLVILLLVGGPGDDPTPPDAGAPIAPVPTSTVATSSVATATVATATVAEAPSPDGVRPTVAAPDAPEAVRRAEALVEAERFAEADRALARLRRTRPNDPAVMILSGMVYVDTNRLSRANRMADRALALDRRSFRAWVLKGSVLQFQRKDAQALKAYERALELGPNHPMSDQLRAVVAALGR